jgi:hypothetical protein
MSQVQVLTRTDKNGEYFADPSTNERVYIPKSADPTTFIVKYLRKAKAKKKRSTKSIKKKPKKSTKVKHSRKTHVPILPIPKQARKPHEFKITLEDDHTKYVPGRPHRPARPPYDYEVDRNIGQQQINWGQRQGQPRVQPVGEQKAAELIQQPEYTIREGKMVRRDRAGDVDAHGRVLQSGLRPNIHGLRGRISPPPQAQPQQPAPALSLVPGFQLGGPPVQTFIRQASPQLNADMAARSRQGDVAVDNIVNQMMQGYSEPEPQQAEVLPDADELLERQREIDRQIRDSMPEPGPSAAPLSADAPTEADAKRPKLGTFATMPTEQQVLDQDLAGIQRETQQLREQLRGKHKSLTDIQSDLYRQITQRSQAGQPAQDLIDEYAKIQDTINYAEEQLGSGNKHFKGIWSTDIARIMQKIPEFQDIIASDQIYKIDFNRKGPISFIMNKDVSSGPGYHWVAFYMPADKTTLEYYDPLADPIQNTVMDEIQYKLKNHGPIKLVENINRQQRINSYNCGFLAIQFLLNRHNGKSFEESIQNSISKQENQVKPIVELYKQGHVIGGDKWL